MASGRISFRRQTATDPSYGLRFLLRTSLALAIMMIFFGNEVAARGIVRDGNQCVTGEPEEPDTDYDQHNKTDASARDEAYKEAYQEYSPDTRNAFLNQQCYNGTCKLSLETFQWICGQPTPKELKLMKQTEPKSVDDGNLCTTGDPPPAKSTDPNITKLDRKGARKLWNDLNAATQDWNSCFERCKTGIGHLSRILFEWICGNAPKNPDGTLCDTSELEPTEYSAKDKKAIKKFGFDEQFDLIYNEKVKELDSIGGLEVYGKSQCISGNCYLSRKSLEFVCGKPVEDEKTTSTTTRKPEDSIEAGSGSTKGILEIMSFCATTLVIVMVMGNL